MATINLDLFCRWQQLKLVTSPTDSTPPTLPPIVAGDTWAIKVAFLDNDGTIHRFVGSTVSARIHAYGNNHDYATAAGSEFAYSAATISRVQTGASNVSEQQGITFLSFPIGGTFRLGFSGAGSGSRGGGYSLGAGTGIYEQFTAPIPWNAWTNEVVHYINEINGFYKGNDGPYIASELHARYGDSFAGVGTESDIRPIVPTSTSSGNGVVISFGGLWGGLNFWNTGIHLLTFDDSALQFPAKYGYAISLPFTDSDFTDYLIPANGPAYFEIVLGGNVAGSALVAAAPSAPVFTNENGFPPNSNVGINYSHIFTASGYAAPTFSVTSGVLPTGLSLAATGRLSGTPTSEGTFSGVITATNSSGSATQPFSITIGGSIIIAPPPGGGGGGTPANVRKIVYDGDHNGAWAVGPMRKESPFKSSPGYYIYRQRYRGFHNIGALGLGTVCPEDANAGLVEETERQDLGGADLVEWDRVWANVPSVPDEFEVFNYPYQQLYQFPNGAWAVFSMILVRTSRVNRTFINTENPGGISLARLPRAIMFNNTPNPMDGFINVTNGSTVIAADDTLERWMGNIWVKTHRTVRI